MYCLVKNMLFPFELLTCFADVLLFEISVSVCISFSYPNFTIRKDPNCILEISASASILGFTTRFRGKNPALSQLRTDHPKFDNLPPS